MVFVSLEPFITVGELFNGKTFFGTIKTLECESMVKLSLEPKQLDLVKHTYLFRTINTRIRVQGFGQWILETMQIYPTSFRQTKQMKCSKIKNDLDNRKTILGGAPCGNGFSCNGKHS